MKKCIAILSLSILTAFSTFFSSCENLVNDEVESTSQKGKINYVNISEVPFLIPTIQKFNPDYAFLSDPSKPSNKETLNLNLDLNSILEYIGLDGRKTYSIKILHEFNDYEDKYLENLHVFKENEEYKSFILKFNSLDDTKPFDENTFTGDAEIYDLEHELQSISNYEDGILRCNKIINGPWHIWIHNGTIDVWYDESYNQGDVDLSSYSNEFVFLATAPPAPGENGGGGAMSTNLDVMLFLNELTEEQLNIVQNYPQIVTYLEQYNASEESQNTILGLLNYILNHDKSQESFDLVGNLINSSIINNFEIDLNYNGNLIEFNNSNDMFNYINESSQVIEDPQPDVSTEFIQNNQLNSEKTIPLSPILNLTIEVVANPAPNFSLVESGCTSYFSNIVVGNSWVQTSMSISKMNYGGEPSDTAEITLKGYNYIGIKLGDLEFGIKQRKKIIFLINKITGKLCCSRVETLTNKL